MSSTTDLNVKIFADGADKQSMLSLYQKPYIKGFTTNPTLMRQAGIVNYKAFAKEILTLITDRPISFEVFADDFETMRSQAMEIASWGNNVYVKIPITNTLGDSSVSLVHELAQQGVKLNVTALMTMKQVKDVSDAIANAVPCNISVFAGRIADTGVDPVPLMTEAVHILSRFPDQELIWASPRELLNVFQADAVGCHIITVTPDVLKKLELVGKCLTEYSLDTVKMFRRDALAAGFSLDEVDEEVAA
jgi:transaldolase